MAKGPDIDALVQAALEKQKEKFQEELRVLQFHAWERGYQACYEGKQRFRNPYRPESPDDAVLDRANLG